MGMGECLHACKNGSMYEFTCWMRGSPAVTRTEAINISDPSVSSTEGHLEKWGCCHPLTWFFFSYHCGNGGGSIWGCRREVISWMFGRLGGSREGTEQTCSGQKEWVKPCQLLGDRTWPWSLCLKEGGSQAASLRQSRVKLETEPQCPGHLLPHTGKKN